MRMRGGREGDEDEGRGDGVEGREGVMRMRGDGIEGKVIGWAMLEEGRGDEDGGRG
jgi:hypothetical protein